MDKIYGGAERLDVEDLLEESGRFISVAHAIRVQIARYRLTLKYSASVRNRNPHDYIKLPKQT